MIHFELPGIPPSANNAYFTKVQRAGKKSIPIRVLTAEGKRYKTDVKTHLARNHQNVLSFFEPNRPYCLVVKLYMLNLLNSTFRKGEATNRYKKVDASNRLKLLEDALTDACGYDDSQHFRVLIWKEEALTAEAVRTEVWAWCWEEEECLFDNLMLAER